MTEKESELLNQLIEEVRLLNGKFDTYIHNDKATGRQGIVSKVDDLEKQMLQMQERNKLKKEISIAVGGIAGGVITGVIQFIQYLIRSNT